MNRPAEGRSDKVCVSRACRQLPSTRLHDQTPPFHVACRVHRTRETRLQTRFDKRSDSSRPCVCASCEPRAGSQQSARTPTRALELVQRFPRPVADQPQLRQPLVSATSANGHRADDVEHRRAAGAAGASAAQQPGPGAGQPRVQGCGVRVPVCVRVKRGRVRSRVGRPTCMQQ
jgi:hypothetical protein